MNLPPASERGKGLEEKGIKKKKKEKKVTTNGERIFVRALLSSTRLFGAGVARKKKRSFTSGLKKEREKDLGRSTTRERKR